ncbi:hypothetical protein EDC01DRAFT_632403 [Geopyxis carbonaria]|nr:hypothetical protein EDC01DRAFT_632403 [Geopyxis carbonaria]
MYSNGIRNYQYNHSPCARRPPVSPDSKSSIQLQFQFIHACTNMTNPGDIQSGQGPVACIQKLSRFCNSQHAVPGCNSTGLICHWIETSQSILTHDLPILHHLILRTLLIIPPAILRPLTPASAAASLHNPHEIPRAPSSPHNALPLLQNPPPPTPGAVSLIELKHLHHPIPPPSIPTPNSQQEHIPHLPRNLLPRLPGKTPYRLIPRPRRRQHQLHHSHLHHLAALRHHGGHHLAAQLGGDFGPCGGEDGVAPVRECEGLVRDAEEVADVGCELRDWGEEAGGGEEELEGFAAVDEVCGEVG